MNSAPAIDTSDESSIEIGIVVAGPLDDIDQEALRLAVGLTKRELEARFNRFTFTFGTVRRPELSEGGRVEPSLLLQQAIEDRDSKHWDFAFVITAADLIGNYSPFCFAALSRPLDAAVVSMSLIDPQAAGFDVDRQTRIDKIATRVSRLFRHALGHLLGLPSDSRPDHLLFHPANAADLDAMTELDEDQIHKQAEALSEIADQRLEEGVGRGMSYPSFATRAAWINRREIWEAVWAARPWEFPKRLSRLTIAAVSTVAILMMSAEAWDLALSQNWLRLSALAIVALVATTFYVIVRQQLLIRRDRSRSEQTVMTTMSAIGIVLTGMTITWLAMLLLAVIVSSLMFDADLIASWAASSGIPESEVGFRSHLRMALFSGSVGLLIGALGASFESQHYFRHVIFVDEEI